jgi:minor histocompatibility antigen H13
MARVLAPAYGGLAVMLALPTVVTVPVPAQMVVLASVTIFIASFHAAARERKRLRDGDAAEPRDVINSAQAWRFPLVASVSLFSMYLAFKYLPKAWVSLALTLYGVVFGGFALANTLAPAIEWIPWVPAGMKKEYGHKDYLLFTGVDVVSIIFATPVAVWYFQTRSWLANNILAAALALSAIDLLAIGDFKTSVILLCGLFVYDAFWVFGSKSIVKENVMVAVAKNFEGPIKLVFPRILDASKPGGGEFSILGLGDIVIPGLFVAMMQRSRLLRGVDDSR